LRPWIAPYSPTAINVKERLADPSLSHLLGTDQLGRDLFSRVILGTRTAMTVALISLGGGAGFGFAARADCRLRTALARCLPDPRLR
jgi:ABC-type dipeptide/oligopeptide/nickel transport system permease subunit